MYIELTTQPALPQQAQYLFKTKRQKCMLQTPLYDQAYTEKEKSESNN